MNEEDCRQLVAETDYRELFYKIKALIVCTEYNVDKGTLFMNLYQCMHNLLLTVQDKKAEKLRKKLIKLYNEGMMILAKERIEKLIKGQYNN